MHFATLIFIILGSAKPYLLLLGEESNLLLNAASGWKVAKSLSRKFWLHEYFYWKDSEEPNLTEN